MTDSSALPTPNLIPEPTLRRLPWYLAYVAMLNERGAEYVSSTQISRELNVDASRIAKDLSFLDVRGKTRIGYKVSQLQRQLEEFLGFKRSHRAVIVGVGSLGSALMQDSGLSNYGLNIVAGFDVDPAVIGSNRQGLEVYDVSGLARECRRLEAEIGILAVPPDHAQEVADRMIAAGLRAIWNFTPYRVTAPEGIVISNTSIYAHLAVMYNRLGH